MCITRACVQVQSDEQNTTRMETKACMQVQSDERVLVYQY